MNFYFNRFGFLLGSFILISCGSPKHDQNQSSSFLQQDRLNAINGLSSAGSTNAIELHLSYSGSAASVRYLYNKGIPTVSSNWQSETVATNMAGGIAGSSPSLILDGSGSPHISMFNSPIFSFPNTNADNVFYHASKSSGLWSLKDTGGRDPLNGGFSALAYTSTGVLNLLKTGMFYGLHFRQKPLNQNWPAPSVLDSEIKNGTVTIPFANLSIAMNSKNVMYATGSRDSSVQEEGQMGRRFARYYAGPGFIEEKLSKGCLSSDMSSVVIDAADGVHDVFICVMPNGTRTLYIGKHLAEGQLGPAAAIRPMMAVGANKLHLVYVNSSKQLVYLNRPLTSTGAFTTPLILDGSGNVSTPQITVTANDVAHVAWVLGTKTVYSQIKNGINSNPISILAEGSGSGLKLGWGFGAKGSRGPSNF